MFAVVVKTATRISDDFSPPLLLLTTVFGPAYTGAVAAEASYTSFINLVSDISNLELDTQLRRFWELESIGLISKPNDNDQVRDVQFTEFLKKHTSYDPVAKRYEVPLVFKSEHQELTNNYRVALKCFEAHERKLDRDGTRHLYNEAMQKYFDRQDAIPVPPHLINVRHCFYLPSQGVYKKNEPSKALRIVFNASFTARSLNSCLNCGPSLMLQICDILLRFRLHPIALTGDISKFFLQIKMRPSDQKFQRFLYRKSASHPIQHMQLANLSFGMSSSPATAVFVARLHAEKYKSHRELGRAADALIQSTFVDDVLLGAETVAEADALRRQCTYIMKQGGFPLSKWVTNSAELLNKIPVTERGADLTRSLAAPGAVASASKPGTEDNQATEESKALGMEWNVQDDYLHFQGYSDLARSLPSKVTKRLIASVVPRLFDPLGFLAPFILEGKKILHDTWQRKLTWDEPVPEDILYAWREWLFHLTDLATFKVPRSITSRAAMKTLHAYGDASDFAIGACIYLRSQYPDGSVTCHLAIAKCKNNPVKTQTMPKKELNASVLATRLAVSTATALRLPLDCIYAYSDSKVVLAFLKQDASKWKIFAQNRCQEILASIPRHRWSHVPGEMNPADWPSRGTSLISLQQKFWLHGPDYLLFPQIPPSEIPPPPTESEKQAIFAEKKPTQDLILLSTTTKRQALLDCLDRIPIVPFSRLLRVTSYIRRVWNNKAPLSDSTSKQFRLPDFKRLASFSTPISKKEESNALFFLLAQSQAINFPDTFTALKAKKEIPHGSSLAALCPFYDTSTGVLRANTRLQKAEFLSQEQRYPIILPAPKLVKGKFFGQDLTARLIWSIHVGNAHSGPKWTLTHLRQKYWILKGLRSINLIVSKCIICKKQNVQRSHQIMAPLPQARLESTEAFGEWMIDYCGHFKVKAPPLQIQSATSEATALMAAEPPVIKIWVLIATCLATRGVHFEPVWGMDLETLIHALRRIIARRGKPRRIYSDHATVFTAADKELNGVFKPTKNGRSKIEIALKSRYEIEWITSTPHSPFKNGLVERIVGLTKHSLFKTIGHQVVPYDVFVSALLHAEQTLQDRPLINVSMDTSDFNVITPSMLIAGRRLSSFPPYQDIPHGAVKYRRRWKQRDALQQHWWARWSQDYVATLAQRSKWQKDGPAFSEGDLVLLADEKQPRKTWRLARVVQIERATDTRALRSGPNRIRSVTVRTADGSQFSRPPQALACLEVSLESSPS